VVGFFIDEFLGVRSASWWHSAIADHSNSVLRQQDARLAGTLRLL
jgi:hypothetical protein